jgi:hypothetical protein
LEVAEKRFAGDFESAAYANFATPAALENNFSFFSGWGNFGGLCFLNIEPWEVLHGLTLVFHRKMWNEASFSDPCAP